MAGSSFSLGPFRFRLGPGPNHDRFRQKAVKTRAGFRLVQKPRADGSHRVTVYNPQGRFIARLHMSPAEWKEFTGAARNH